MVFFTNQAKLITEDNRLICYILFYFFLIFWYILLHGPYFCQHKNTDRNTFEERDVSKTLCYTPHRWGFLMRRIMFIRSRDATCIMWPATAKQTLKSCKVMKSRQTMLTEKKISIRISVSPPRRGNIAIMSVGKNKCSFHKIFLLNYCVKF